MKTMRELAGVLFLGYCALALMVGNYILMRWIISGELPDYPQ